MTISMKHRNIGATVSMLKLIGGVTSKNKLPKAITKLFMVESDECDYKQNGHCMFEVDPEPCISPMKCMIGECPLGAIVDEESKNTGSLEFGCDPDDRLVLYGKNTMGYHTQGGHIHVGYTGWRKHWDNFKKMVRGWFS